MTVIEELSKRYWDVYLTNKPTFATLIGAHEYDDRIEDLSESGRASHISSLLTLAVDVEATDPSDDPMTHALLESMLSVDVAEAETEVLVWPPDANLGIHSELLRWTAQTRASEPAHAGALALRYEQVPRLLDQALARHGRLAADGVSPTRTSVQRVIDQIDAYLASELHTDPFISLQLPDDWDGASTWRSRMEETVATEIRPAFATYRTGLAEQVLPSGRGNDQVGVVHLPGGDDIYRRLVRRFVTVPYDPAEVHRIGHLHATETLMDEWASTGEGAFGISDRADLFERLRTDSSLRYSSEEEMLSHAEEVVTRAWSAIDGWLGARPDGPCRVLPVPDALAKDMPPAYYLQPSPDGSRPGTYFLNTYRPYTRDRFAAEATAFHEAIPGHHFDRALAASLTDLPDFRRFRPHNVHAEGWGLYSERLADEMGLYSGPVDRLGMLMADSWRAARLVVDTGIHHHGWTRDQAVQYLVDWTPINRPTIEQEVDRYIGWPGQALSYKMGQIEIERLRRQAEERLGSSFDIVGFHDAVLTSGSVTMPVLGQIVSDWVESRSP
ncbi:MAG TPA: DUF885 domain-containing protein [Acidimicrobiia bacterium]|nr:DUF885 domain-containing protein [Acidimicrobiia bacterium]